jgi:hypothetical protein
MTDINKDQPQVIQPFSDEKHGGVLLPAIFGTLGFGILLYGIFMGSTGLYGDTSEITFADGVYEFWRELVRILVFSLLLLAAIRVNCWRMRRPLGKLFLAALRCLAIVVLIDSVRVVEMEHGLARVTLVSIAQFVVCSAAVTMFFASTVRESILFSIGCTVGVVLLWLGAHVGIWII